MAVKSEGAPASDGEAAAHRRWLITIVITVLFGGFGAVMAYLSYANSSKAPSTGQSNRAPSSAPTNPPAAAPVAEPSGDEGNKDKPENGTRHKDK